MKILIACEESQAVCIEMRKRGHEAYSCDIEPCSGGHPEWHLQQDVLPLLKEKWDMIIAFPPCTDLAVSGAAWFEQKRKDGRQQKSIDFFMQFANCDCPKVVIENPVGIMSTNWRKPDQIIQPWQFGDPFSKNTCLWLKGVPKLTPMQALEKPNGGWNNQHFTGGKYTGYVNYDEHGKVLAWNSKEIKKKRSKTFPGIAKAMAEQWG